MPSNDPNDSANHWESVYASKASTSVSWYAEHLEVSLDLLDKAGLSAESRVIDVGGGASTLVDDLLDRGVQHLTVIDLSAAAMAVARERIGARASSVAWLPGDITRIPLSASGYTHWHDRAVLHFLTGDTEVRAYAAQAERAVMSGGHAVIGGFAPDGPERCSGLPVARRSAEDIAACLGANFELIETRKHHHRTPGGAEQAFEYALLRRR
jgi:SAM-dependent methyltransferase